MTNEEKLKLLTTQIDGLYEQHRKLTVTKQQTQSALDTIETQRHQVLRAHAGGDSNAGARLDEFEREEKDLRRRLSGMELLIAEMDSEIAALTQERIPIESLIRRAEFHRQAAQLRQIVDADLSELEQAVLEVATRLATVRLNTNAIYALCNGNPEGSEYLNPVISRLGALQLVVGRKVDKEGWAEPLGTLAGVPYRLTIQAALPPADAASKAA